MSTVLIAGANRGLGLEFTRQYAEAGWSVIATCRDPLNPGELASLQGDIEVHSLDVTDFHGVEALANTLSGRAIDVLICNAGVYGPKPCSLGGIDYDAWAPVMRVNVYAPLNLCECFLPHVAKSDQKKIAVLSSKMGSMTDNTSGGSYIYRASKAALNAVMKSLALDVRDQDVAVAMLHPGWVRTDMGGPNGLIDAPESISGMRAVIDGLGVDSSGGFFAYDGAPIPW